MLACFGLAGCSFPSGEGNLPVTRPSAQEAGGQGGTSSSFDGADAPRLVSVEDVSSAVRIGSYENLIPEAKEVTDQEVEERIRSLLDKDSSSLRAGQGEIAEGDTVVINYVGTVNYKTFEGSVANNYSLVVGSGEMTAGFEEALIGMTPGQTKAFTLTAPEDDRRQDLAGVPVSYRVTVQSASRPAVLDDDWAKTQGYENTDALREGIRQELEKEARTAEMWRTQLWQQIVNSSEVIQYPEKDLEAAARSYHDLVGRYAEQAEMDLETFLASQGMTMDQFEEQADVYARSKVRQNLIVQGIMDQEGMSLDDPECTQIYADLVKEYNLDGKGSRAELYTDQEINETVGLIRVLDYVLGMTELY